jgi:tRNA threonylcarbamoyladenosine biosynthesis protein TsaB
VLGAAHWRSERAHVGELPAQVEGLLARCAIGAGGVDGVAVSIGPGSFTGLRIAVAFAKGLAFAGGLPVAVVPTLEGLAAIAGAPPAARVCVALDARKREIYAAFFDIDPDGAVRRGTPDAVWQPSALAAACDATTIVVGDASDVYVEVFTRTVVRPFATHHPHGEVIAARGWARLVAGEHVPIGTLEPAYVRAPDAKLPDNPLR